jgi:hypothetical protein
LNLIRVMPAKGRVGRIVRRFSFPVWLNFGLGIRASENRLLMLSKAEWPPGGQPGTAAQAARKKK